MSKRKKSKSCGRWDRKLRWTQWTTFSHFVTMHSHAASAIPWFSSPISSYAKRSFFLFPRSGPFKECHEMVRCTQSGSGKRKKKRNLCMHHAWLGHNIKFLLSLLSFVCCGQSHGIACIKSSLRYAFLFYFSMSRTNHMIATLWCTACSPGLRN